MKLLSPLIKFMNRFTITFIALLIPISVAAQADESRTTGNVPIGFYGKVVDQSGNAITDAKITFEIIVSHFDEFTTESIPGQTQSDQTGLFEITGATGRGIDKISIQKIGYQLSPKTVINYTFGPNSNYNGSATNPVIFKMWKMSGKEPLISVAWHGKVACDGTTNRFSLRTGGRRDDGDLEIICSKMPQTVPPPGKAHFDYKFQIIILNGEIQPTGDEFTFLAPDNGYAPSFTVVHKANDPDRRGSLQQEFYIKTSKGYYGRLSVDWYAWQTPPTILKWDSSINPSGSRNLER